MDGNIFPGLGVISFFLCGHKGPPPIELLRLQCISYTSKPGFMMLFAIILLVVGKSFFGTVFVSSREQICKLVSCFVLLCVCWKNFVSVLSEF